MMKTLVIIPAHNEEKNIRKIVDELVAKSPHSDYVIINDGSTDDTLRICRERGYHVINLPVNLGLTAAVQTGMIYAKRHDYDCAIQIDGDGQHDPAYIAAFEKNMTADVDLVIGSRFVSRRRERTLRMFGNNVIRLALRAATGQHFSDPTSGMRMYNRKLISIMADTYDLGPEPDTLAYLVWSGAKFREIQIDIRERTGGESYLSIKNAIKYMTYMLASILLFQRFRKKQSLGGEPV